MPAAGAGTRPNTTTTTTRKRSTRRSTTFTGSSSSGGGGGASSRTQRASDAMASVFTHQGWARFATGELLKASTAVDQVCHAIVGAKRRYVRCAVADELRDLALTVAIFERSLFAYADRIRIHTLAADARRRSAFTEKAVSRIAEEDNEEDDEKLQTSSVSVSVQTTPPPSLIELDTASPTVEASDEHSEHGGGVRRRRREQPPRYPWKHSGGVVSLLSLLSLNLSKMRLSLHELVRLSSLRTFLLYSWRQHSSLLVLMWAATLFGVSRVLRRTFVGSWAGARSLKELLRRSGRVQLGTLLLAVLHVLWWHRRRRVTELRRLHALHRQLSVLLRLWHLCTSVLDYDDDVDALVQKTPQQRARGGMPISRWLLEQVPPSLKAAWWYRSSWRLTLLSHTLNVLYASVRFWYSVSGARWFGAPLAVGAGVVYALRPRLASRTSTELLASPDVRLAKAAWAVHDRIATHCFAWTHLLLSTRLAIIRDIEFQVPSGAKRRLTMLRARCGDGRVHARAPLVLHLHGGGWMANVLGSHMRYLSEWALRVDAPVVSLGLQLDTDHSYVDAVAEAFAAYAWIASGGLGFVPSAIVLVGDSVGGNLAVSVCVKTMLSERIRRPDALVLAYPVLNLELNPSPSRFMFMMDAIVPMNLLHQCRSIYMPPRIDDSDLCVSAVSVPDRLLKSFPPTSIMVGGLDPFLDDAVDLAHRLAALGVFCQLKLYPRLPHAFLAFSLLLPEARRASGLAGSWIAHAIRRRSPPQPSTTF